MKKAVLIAAALVLAPLPLASQEMQDRKDRDPAYAGKGGEQAGTTRQVDDQVRSALRDRVVQAIETIEEACAADVDDFCGRVTSGEGRIAMCMRAHEDQISSGCRSALYRVAGTLRRNVDRVAEGCWNEIQAQCGDAGKIGQCLEQKKSSFSSSCQTIIGALEQRIHQRTSLVGMPVYSSDNKNLGEIVEVVKGPGNEVRAVQVDIGRMLGLGTKVVTIPADKLQQVPGIKALLSDTEVRSLPEAKKQ
jgi:PRC-barrel domain